jgi:diacylglycerol O-acyltransferase
VTNALATESPAADNTLAYIDQASFLWVRASGHVHGIQATWVYRRDIDVDGLTQVLDNLAHGLLGRGVERSPLPVGRHRWVTQNNLARIYFAPRVSSRSALADWVVERAEVPIDPERGPGWHVGVLPIDDYGTAVSLVVSHTVIDVMGLCLAVADAVNGVMHDLGYPPPGSRPRGRALRADARQAAKDVPDLLRALAALPKQARRAKSSPDRPAARAPVGTQADVPVSMPTATVYIDLDAWDDRAEALGGTSNSLFAGFAARLAQRRGRVRADGMVNLTYPVNDRTEHDTRANALKSVELVVDPNTVTTDLRAARAAIKHALVLGLGNFKDQQALLPLTPLLPTAVVRRVPAEAAGAADLPVGCSNSGDVDSATTRVDGTAADYFSIRLIAQNLRTSSTELAFGELYFLSGRACGKLFITARAYRPGKRNSRDELCQLISQTLADFDLEGDIE